MEKMAKISKFTEKIKKIKRTALVPFTTDEGNVIEFKIESLSEKAIDEINAKYDAKKPKVPTKRLPVAGGKFKTIEDTENPEYRRAYSQVQKENFAELALAFLAEDEKPEGTLEEQLQELVNVELAGFIPKLVQRGLEISAVIEEKEDNYDEELIEAKND